MTNLHHKAEYMVILAGNPNVESAQGPAHARSYRARPAGIVNGSATAIFRRCIRRLK
jgi:hypothetical protein